MPQLQIKEMSFELGPENSNNSAGKRRKNAAMFRL
jgi:hypothetical protein